MFPGAVPPSALIAAESSSISPEHLHVHVDGHRLADAVRHRPSRLVVNAKDALLEAITDSTIEALTRVKAVELLRSVLCSSRF